MSRYSKAKVNNRALELLEKLMEKIVGGKDIDGSALISLLDIKAINYLKDMATEEKIQREVFDLNNEG